jgi:hypothetical protein
VKIHRSRSGSHFTQIPDAMLRDERLGYAARGILCELLSRPDDWETTADKTTERARRERSTRGESRRVVRAAFAELKDAGYMVVKRVPLPGGKWGSEVHVYDQPQTDVPASGTSVPPAEIHITAGEIGVPHAGTSGSQPELGTGVPEAGTSASPATTGVLPARTDVPSTGIPHAGTSLRTLSTNREISLASQLVRIVTDATDATPQEARQIIKAITERRKPDTPLSYFRRVAANGDLVVWLQELRDDRIQVDTPTVAQLVATLREGPPCEHGDPGGASPHPQSGQRLCPQCRRKSA